MKIHIKPYLDYFGPYQLASAILFWLDKDSDTVEAFGAWIADTKICDILQYIYSKRERNHKIRIDDYDTWSMDTTLSYIIAPMLVQLKKTKHGAPDVDDSDVPEHLHKCNAEPQTEEEIVNHHADSNHFLRWDYVLDEMIFAFQAKPTDWELEFASGEADFTFEPTDDTSKYYSMVTGPNHTYKVDWEGRNAFQARMTNGFRLFGKYYEGLWD